MLDSIKPGQDIRCTVKIDVNRDADEKTIARLMRQDPEHRRRLKSAQGFRMKNLIVRSRGKRPWAVRQKASKVVRAAKGEQWTMRYIPQLANDLRAVERYLTIETA